MRRASFALIAIAVIVLAFVVTSRKRDVKGGEGDAAAARSGCSRGGPMEADRASPRGEPPRAPEKTVRDPARRYVAREQLREKLGAKFPKAKPSGQPPAPPAGEPPDEPGAHIDPKYIQQRVREDFFPLARECYETVLKQNPKASGKVALHFVIVGDESVGGIVEEANVGDESTLRDPEFDTCIQESMMSLTFPPPKGQGAITVTYPIVFAPDDEDDDGGASK